MFFAHLTCRNSLCFLCPNPYPFPTGFSENTRVYAPGFGTIAAKMLRINPDLGKKRSGYILWPLRISLGIYLGAAQEIAWDFSGGRSGYPRAAREVQGGMWQAAQAAQAVQRSPGLWGLGRPSYEPCTLQRVRTAEALAALPRLHPAMTAQGKRVA